MKKVFVLMRVIVFKDQTAARFPVGVYTDKEDALRASQGFTKSLSGLTDEAKQLLGYLGIQGVSGVVVEQDFVPGSGLQVVDRPPLILPGS